MNSRRLHRTRPFLVSRSGIQHLRNEDDRAACGPVEESADDAFERTCRRCMHTYAAIEMHRDFDWGEY